MVSKESSFTLVSISNDSFFDSASEYLFKYGSKHYEMQPSNLNTRRAASFWTSGPLNLRWISFSNSVDCCIASIISWTSMSWNYELRISSRCSLVILQNSNAINSFICQFAGNKSWNCWLASLTVRLNQANRRFVFSNVAFGLPGSNNSRYGSRKNILYQLLRSFNACPPIAVMTRQASDNCSLTPFFCILLKSSSTCSRNSFVSRSRSSLSCFISGVDYT